MLESKDVTGAINFSLSLRNAVNNMGLCDSWEALRGYAVEFSYVTSGSGSRIDRCYVSSSLKTKLKVSGMHVLSFSKKIDSVVRRNRTSDVICQISYKMLTGLPIKSHPSNILEVY